MNLAHIKCLSMLLGALCIVQTVCYLRSRIPFNGPYTLTMNRTNWKLGELNINALVLGIVYDHMYI